MLVWDRQGKGPLGAGLCASNEKGERRERKRPGRSLSELELWQEGRDSHPHPSGSPAAPGLTVGGSDLDTWPGLRGCLARGAVL